MMSSLEEALKARKMVVVLGADAALRHNLTSLASNHKVPSRVTSDWIGESRGIWWERNATRRAVALASRMDLSGTKEVRPYGLLLFTSSDIVVRELSICLMINLINEDWDATNEYQEDETLLSHSMIAVFHFKDGKLNPVEVTKQGFRIPGEDEEMAKMSALEQDCFHAIDEMKT